MAARSRPSAMDIDHELVFKVLLISEFSAFSVVRIVYQQISARAGRRTVISESRRYAAFLSIFICYEVFTFFMFIFWPQWFAWARIELPLGVRWTGAIIGLLSLVIFVWVHRSLGMNLSATLKIKEAHALVTDGPYRWVRHPMYTAFFLLHIGALLMTANWFIGGTWTAGLLLVLIFRVRREEEMLLRYFGDQYRKYMARTPRFIPTFPDYLCKGVLRDHRSLRD
ncbi:MAG: isoprenylcysteine carboxylmethyltransferase family protein [Dehalococcoidia bacterium]|nr:isoprenylcysteine carboxylmethyltransferase family protein [Dehalococcoidia bacterium]